jgi:uncharacterized membrane protein
MTAVFSVVAMELSALNAMNILAILINTYIFVVICCYWMPFAIDSDYLAGSAKLALKKLIRRKKAL